MITVIDYDMGNIGSILNMLKKVGAAATITSDIEEVETADKIILPGVGAFGQGMKILRERNLIPILNKKVLEDKTPILGICLGTQLFTKKSEEGNIEGLGWIDAETIRFKFEDESNEAAGRSANVGGDEAGDGQIEGLQPMLKLFAAATDVS